MELFAEAIHWKRYFSGKIGRYLRGRVLEVGAGLGGSTGRLLDAARGPVEQWVCLEPDAGQCERMQALLESQGRIPPCSVQAGTLETLEESPAYDVILYIDVLEHIRDDRQELRRATLRLRPGGNLVVLAPAFGCLMSPFDRAIGHYRRYTRSRLRRLASASLELTRSFYLDSVGFFASGANRLLLRKALPKPGQIHLWDRWMVPVSTWLDRLAWPLLGRSVAGIYTRIES